MSAKLNLLVKQKRVKEVSSELTNYPVVAIANLHSLPGRQLHDIKKKLYGRAVLKMGKKSVLTRAVENNKEISNLQEYMQSGQPAIVLTKENPFKLYNFLQKNKSKASAKAGDVLQNDVTVSAGITNVAPGPAIGVFKKFGLQTKVTQGKLEVVGDKVVAKAGDTVNAEMLALFTMLGIQPMEIGLNIVAAYEDGTIYSKDVLGVSEEEYIGMIQKAYQSAFNLAFNAEIYMKENIEAFISKAVRATKAVESEAKIESPKEEAKEEPAQEAPTTEEATSAPQESASDEQPSNV